MEKLYVENEKVQEQARSFEKNPDALISYVESARASGNRVLGTHVMQVAFLAEECPRISGVFHYKMPEVFCDVRKIDNIVSLIQKARIHKYKVLARGESMIRGVSRSGYGSTNVMRRSF